MNLLLSSTQTWNPGDDFIRFGCLAILEAALGPHTELHTSIFDRNPRLSTTSSGRDNTQANVLTEADTLDGYDALLIAGTPAWGKSNDRLYKHALKTGIPILMLGLGGQSADRIQAAMSPHTEFALQAAALITVRDQVTSDFLTHLHIPHHHLPCPATLASFYRPDVAAPARAWGSPSPLLSALPISAFPTGTVIVTSDVPEIQATALEAQARHPHATLLCHSAHERNRLFAAGHRPVYDHDPHRLLAHLLRHQHLISGRLHAALPFLGAGAGRTTELLPNVCPRIQGGHQTVQAYLTTHTPADLLQTYTTLLHPILQSIPH